MAALGGASHLIKENGRKRINVSQNGKCVMTLVAEWKAPGVPPAGVLVFSIDGDPGMNNVQDLSTGKRAWTTNGRPSFFDVDVLNLPGGAEFFLHVW